MNGEGSDPICHVWNVTQDYCEHVGPRSDCAYWVRNVKRLGLTRDVFQIHLGRPRR